MISPPSNIDIKDLVSGHRVGPRPVDEPTFATYVILRRRLGEIVAKVSCSSIPSQISAAFQVTQHFQRLHGQTPYRDVEELDAEFKSLVEDLPSCYRMVNPDKSYDKGEHPMGDTASWLKKSARSGNVVAGHTPVLHSD